MDTSREQLKQELDALWQKYLPLTTSRMEILGRAVSALGRGDLSDDLRVQAAQAAHKLAGAMGTFGLQQYSDDAAELERLFEARNFGDASVKRVVESYERLSRFQKERNHESARH